MRSKIAVLVLLASLLVCAYRLGQRSTDQHCAAMLQAQWDAETKRLEYAYEMTDSCASDQCLEAWSELIHNPQAK